MCVIFVVCVQSMLFFNLWLCKYSGMDCVCVLCRLFFCEFFFLFSFFLSLSSVQSNIIKSLCLNSVFQLYLIVLLADTECWSPKYNYTD